MNTSADGKAIPEQELYHKRRHSAAPAAASGRPLCCGPPGAAGKRRWRDAAQATLLLRSHGHAADICTDQDHAPPGQDITYIHTGASTVR